jgi:hypothetical protein
VNAAPRPLLTAPQLGQASWPLLAPSAAPSAPLQAWQDLPTARLGGSGDEGGRLPLQGLRPPSPPIASGPLAEQAGPRSSTVAQTPAPMVVGPTWASGAAVAGEDATFPLDATALQPSSPSPTAGASGALALNDEEMELLWDAVA